MPPTTSFFSLAQAFALGREPRDLLPELHRELLVAVGSSRSLLLQRSRPSGTYVATSGGGAGELGMTVPGGEAQRLDALAADGPVVADLAAMPTLRIRLDASRALVVPLGAIRPVSVLLVADPGVPHLEAEAVARNAAIAFGVALEWSRLARESAFYQQLRELSLVFPRGASPTHSMASAVERLAQEANTLLGTERMSVWLHDRRARELVLTACSDRQHAATATRTGVDDYATAAARGLRLDRPEVLPGPDRILIAPLRGWRRALGTLVAEGLAAGNLDDEQLVELAHELARQISAGVENLQLLDEVIRQHRLLDNTFNSLADLVIVTDNALRVVQTNEAFAARVRGTRPALFGQPLGDLIGGEMAAWAVGREGITQTFNDERLHGTFAATRTALINDDGALVGRVLVARDITQQARLEAESEALRVRLAQFEKLASLGQFVAGIAHEMNNPLQGVLGHLELLMERSTPELRRDLQGIYQEADRAAKIVRNLLVFSGSQRLARRRLRIERVLARALSSRRAALRRAHIEVVRRQQADPLPIVSGDPLLLQQAFLNVLINAEHAIAESNGAGTIEIGLDTNEEKTAVVVTIRDSGAGIAADALPCIFDPFFTTKDVGKGTGLGLAITYGIIQEHGGAIHASNSPLGGAVFTIELPAG